MKLSDEPLSLTYVRDLLETDKPALALKALGGGVARRMRDSHHALARAVASGMDQIEASRITGFSQGYISDLTQNDPAFGELLAYYRKETAKDHADLRERLTILALDVSQEVADRLREAPETFSNGDLRQFLTALADRTGHGPSSTVHAEVDIIDHLSYSEQKALAEALEAMNKKMIDVTPNREDAA